MFTDFASEKVRDEVLLIARILGAPQGLYAKPRFLGHIENTWAWPKLHLPQTGAHIFIV